MKKVKICGIFWGMVLLILLPFQSGCSSRKIANLESRGTNIICLGDSITKGKGVAPQDSYPSVLAKMVNIPVINAGINSDVTPEGVKRLKTDVLDNHPLLVIIEFGGNDYLNKLPLEETLRNIEEMIKTIQDAGAMVAIADIGNIIFMSEYSQEFKRLSRKYQAIFIPSIMEDIVTNERLKSDQIHPNAKGYKIIAHRIYRAIVPYLNRNYIFRNQGNRLLDSSRAFR